MRRPLIVCQFGILIQLALIAPLAAQTTLHDPSLPTVKPQQLRRLSDDRLRQQIIAHSQARYPGQCVCPYMTKDTSGRSCKGRHAVIERKPEPICYPSQITGRMLTDWRARHP